MGRALLCAPFFSTVVLAANTLLHVRRRRRQEGATCPGIASGETIATLAFTEPSGKWDEAGITPTATKSRRRLDAQRHEDVRARRPHRRPDHRRRPHRRRRAACSPSTATPPGLTRTRAVDDGPDPQAGQARVRRHAGHADRHRRRRLGRAVDRCSTSPPSALAAEQVGGAQKVLEMAVEYAKVRVQFGRPIGSFQAIKHKCADMLLEVESAKSAAYYAVLVRRRDERRAALGGLAGQGVLLARPTSTPPPRTSRSTAASASPGSTRRTCTSSGPSAPSCCSATRPTTASCSPSASASERTHRRCRGSDRLRHRRRRHRS